MFFIGLGGLKIFVDDDFEIPLELVQENDGPAQLEPCHFLDPESQLLELTKESTLREYLIWLTDVVLIVLTFILLHIVLLSVKVLVIIEEILVIVLIVVVVLFLVHFVLNSSFKSIFIHFKTILTALLGY